MTKRAAHRVCPPYRLVALCLLLLQLVGALHFSLIPHTVGAGSGSLVHLRRVLPTQRERALASDATRTAPDRRSIVAGSASCDPEACPIAFSGPHSRLVAASELSALIAAGASKVLLPRERTDVARSRALLNAPKTSPPLRA